jgi:hypothetical protein
MLFLRRLLPAALPALLLVAAPAAAQDGFRIAYETDASRPERVRLVGTLTNERPTDVFEVSVMGEGLNQGGKVVAKGIAYVDSRVPRGASRPFAISVPAVAGVVRYRVVVSTFRAGLGAESP